MTLNKENIFNNIKNIPGIYLIKNIINNKCYIGQTLKLRKRLLTHINLYNNNNRKYPIYKAFEKYGLNNFDIEILKTYNIDNRKQLKQQLNNDEIYYIKKYNSFGNTGYNQTLGGDGGITGYKFTEEQKYKNSINAKISQNDGRNNIYVYNIDTDKIITYTSFTDMSKKLNKKYSSKNLKSFIVNKKYIISKTLEDLSNKIYKYKNKEYTDGKFKIKINKEDYNDLINYYFNHTVEDTMKKYNCCKKTIYNILKNCNVKTKINNV